MNMSALLLTIVLSSTPGLAQNEQQKDEATVPDKATLEQQFEQQLSGVVLTGNYTASRKGVKQDSPAPKKDRYTITKVSKVGEDRWRFFARIEYGDKDVTIPFDLTVKWAGDTPVITLTNLTIPLLGTYSARVVIYEDSYAGVWSGGMYGGQLWGRIEKLEESQEAEQPRNNAEETKQLQ